MASNINILASGTSDSVQSATVSVEATPITISLFGTLGSDTADLQRKASDDSWMDVFDGDGQVILSATRPQVEITGVGEYRLDVTTRTGSWGADASPFDKNAF